MAALQKGCNMARTQRAAHVQYGPRVGNLYSRVARQIWLAPPVLVDNELDQKIATRLTCYSLLASDESEQNMIDSNFLKPCYSKFGVWIE